MKPHLELRGISKRFRSGRRTVSVLRDVTLSIEKGEVLAILGPSGAGKTTLLQIVAGFMPADAGTAELAGAPLPLAGRRGGRGAMSFIFQDPYAALSPHLRVLETVTEPLALRGVHSTTRRRRALRVLDSLAMTPPEAYLDRYPNQLSGGQQQRVAIGRALITAPELLLADEPTSMLDASVAVDILNLLRRLADRGLTVLVTLHDFPAACYMADRLAVLDRGAVVEAGHPARLVSNPQQDVTREMLRGFSNSRALRNEKGDSNEDLHLRKRRQRQEHGGGPDGRTERQAGQERAGGRLR